MARISPRHWFMILSIILGPQNFYRDRWGSFFNFFFVGVVLTSKMLPPTKGRSRNRRGGNSRRGNNTVGERSVILDGTGYLNSPNLLWLVPVSSSPSFFINRFLVNLLLEKQIIMLSKLLMPYYVDSVHVWLSATKKWCPSQTLASWKHCLIVQYF